MTLTYRLTDQHDGDVADLGRRLDGYNSAHVAPSQKRRLSILARDDATGLIAGLSGETAWGWLYIRWLWVDSAYWRQGIAGSLLDRAEAEAKERGCVGAHIDTFNPTAVAVYKRQGYDVYGEIPGYVAGQARTYLQKRWA